MVDELYRFIGNRIRELRQNYRGKGISQDVLAQELKTTPNTISRWETALYKPTANDLDRLAKFFGVPISTFFPDTDNTRLQALLSATSDLHDQDFDELIEYARFRKARTILDSAKRKRQKKES